jgi:outer membrane protein TolC
MKKQTFLLLLLFGCARLAVAQEDSALEFSFEQYMLLVQTEHPIALQAQLQVAKGDAALLQARGAFDPKVFTTIDQKYFDGTQYYNRVNGGLKIPTWFGAELNAGFEENNGVYLNPENTTPSSGLLYAGISLPLGQGLFIDQRRAALRSAQIFQNITAADRQLILTNLQLETGTDYWNWFASYHALNVYENALQLAEQRFTGIAQSARLGDRPAIDTLEAGILVQNRALLFQEATLNFDNATARLSVHLWSNGNVPLELANETKPPPLSVVKAVPVEPRYIALLDSLTESHPEIVRTTLKLDQLQLERRLKGDLLKPQLNLQYNPLTARSNADPVANYSINNYKWGLQFSMPILLRKERGALDMADLKIQEMELDFAMKQAEVVYKVNASLNKWETSASQVALYTQTVLDYGSLLNGEVQMFNIGESSLFMVNSREVGYINAQIKFIALLAKNQKSTLETAYAFGVILQ